MSSLEREKKIEELEEKIRSLEAFSREEQMDLSREIVRLKKKVGALRAQNYQDLDPWDRVVLARLRGRPTALDYIGALFDDFVEFHGDRGFGDDPALVGGIARLGDRPVTVIGQQKGRDTPESIARNFGMMQPEGYRKALRLMRQAEKFRRPVVCFVDTPGAFCGIEAEERGQGEAIARNLLEMSRLRTPVVSVVIGEGGSGGALGLAVADRVYMLENAIYSILSPEGFASILWKDASLARKAAGVMKITADDLHRLGVVDAVIPEPVGGAHKDPDPVYRQVGEILARDLAELGGKDPAVLVEERYGRFRRFGTQPEETGDE